MGDNNDESEVSHPGAKARLSISCEVRYMQKID